MNLLDSLKKDFQVAESYVLAVIADIQRAEVTLESDVKLADAWIKSHIGQVVDDLAQVTKVVGQLASSGVSLPAAVTTAVKDANIAVSGLNAYVEASKGGAGTPGAVVQGYVAAKQVAALTASAAIAVATAPVAGQAPVVAVEK